MDKEYKEYIERLLEDLRKDLTENQMEIMIEEGTTSHYDGHKIVDVTPNGTKTVTIKINGGAKDDSIWGLSQA